MDRRSTVLFLFFIAALVTAAAFSYQRIIIKKAYGVVETQESLISLPDLK